MLATSFWLISSPAVGKGGHFDTHPFDPLAARLHCAGSAVTLAFAVCQSQRNSLKPSRLLRLRSFCVLNCSASSFVENGHALICLEDMTPTVRAGRVH